MQTLASSAVLALAVAGLVRVADIATERAGKRFWEFVSQRTR